MQIKNGGRTNYYVASENEGEKEAVPHQAIEQEPNAVCQNWG